MALAAAVVTAHQRTVAQLDLHPRIHAALKKGTKEGSSSSLPFTVLPSIIDYRVEGFPSTL